MTGRAYNTPRGKTLAAPARVEGTGLFTGAPAGITIEPGRSWYGDSVSNGRRAVASSRRTG